MCPTRILVITLSNIGDAIMSTPVLAALHARYPEALIDLVCDVRSSALFKPCPYIGHLFERDKSHGWMGYLKLVALLRQTRYDIVVDLRTDFLVHLLRAKQKFKKKSNVSTLDIHSVNKHLAAVQRLVGDSTPNLELWVSAQDQRVVDAQFPCDGRLLAVGLGANFAGKVWPLERYIAVANALSGKIDGVVLLGNTAERILAERFSAQVTLPVYNACGNLTLAQSYALLKRCYFYIGNDSGLGHMAAAANLPTLTLFGPGSPVRYLPWSPQAYFIQDPQHNVLGITVTDVLTKLQALFIQINR